MEECAERERPERHRERESRTYYYYLCLVINVLARHILNHQSLSLVLTPSSTLLVVWYAIPWRIFISSIILERKKLEMLVVSVRQSRPVPSSRTEKQILTHSVVGYKSNPLLPMRERKRLGFLSFFYVIHHVEAGGLGGRSFIQIRHTHS